MSAAESLKAKQDYELVKLETAVHRARTQLGHADDRHDLQRSIKGEAVALLTEAGDEMEAVRFESKVLLSRWNTALVTVSKHDESLAKAEREVTAGQEELSGMSSEDAALRKDIAALSTAVTELGERAQRQMAIRASAQDTEAHAAAQLSAAEARHVELSGVAMSLREDAKRLTASAAALVKRAAEAEAARVRAERERHTTDAQTVEALTDASTAETAERNVLRDAGALMQRVQALELQAAVAEDGIAGAQLEATRGLAALAALRLELDTAEAAVTAREGEVAALEEAAAGRQASIERKMAQLDRLNRTYDGLVAGLPVAENMGPLHAEVANTAAALEAKRRNLTALQRRWLSDQTQLVTVSSDCEAAAAKARELTSRAALLAVRRTRLQASTDGQLEEVRALNTAVGAMHGDVGRLNALLAHNERACETLAAGTVASERAFAETLAGMEQAAEEAEGRIAALAGERDRLTASILDCERQADAIAQWTILEEEAQGALDPSAGAGEVAATERELAAMTARRDALIRQKASLVADVERALDKREALVQRSKAADRAYEPSARRAVSPTCAGGTAGGATTTSTTALDVRARASRLEGELRSKTAVCEELEYQGRLKEQQALDAAAAAATHAAAVDSLRAEVCSLSGELAGIQARAIAVGDASSHVAVILRRLQLWEAGRLPALTGEEARGIAGKLAAARKAASAVTSCAASVEIATAGAPAALALIPWPALACGSGTGNELACAIAAACASYLESIAQALELVEQTVPGQAT